MKLKNYLKKLLKINNNKFSPSKCELYGFFLDVKKLVLLVIQ